MSCPQPNRKVASLHPLYAQRFMDFLNSLERTFPQFNIIVTETLRSDERQACLRKSGASKTARSNHQDGNAMDIALYRHSTKELDWRPAVFRNVYRMVDPWQFGLTTGAHLWQWDEGHIQPIELQGKGKALSLAMEAYEH